MNARTKKLLMNLIIHIMHMLCEQGNIFSQKDRTQLATLVAQLQGAMDETKPKGMRAKRRPSEQSK
jgi:hypothetical protein